MRVGLLGGTFDPIHNGHLRLAQSARRQLRLSKVYAVLSPRSPFKLSHRLSPVADRKKWLTAALQGRRGLGLGPWELRQKGPTYTVLTLRRLRRKYPSWKLFLIMGSDSFRRLGRWKNPEEIAASATVVVGRRPGTLRVVIPKKMKGSVRILRGVFPDVSSTQIRRLIRKNSTFARRLVPPRVYAQLTRTAGK